MVDVGLTQMLKSQQQGHVATGAKLAYYQECSQNGTLISFASHCQEAGADCSKYRQSGDEATLVLNAAVMSLQMSEMQWSTRRRPLKIQQASQSHKRQALD